MQVVSAFSFVAPLGCALMQAEMHASSRHASPQEMSAVQSASDTQAVFSAQQLASMHVSHVASPLRSPHVPPSAPAPPGTASPGFLPDFAAIAEMVFATPLGRESASFDCQWLACALALGVFPGASVVSMVVVLVHANVSVDVMAITPKVMALICPPKQVGAWARNGSASRTRDPIEGALSPLPCARAAGDDVPFRSAPTMQSVVETFEKNFGQ